MSDPWGQPPQQGGYGQQPNYQPPFQGQQPGYQNQQPGYQGPQSGYQGQAGYPNQQQPYGQPAPQMQPQQQPMQQPMSPYGQPAVQPGPQQALPQQPEPKTGRMSSSTSRLISGLVVLAIIGGGAIMYFVTHNGNSGGGSANASSTSAAGSGNGSGSSGGAANGSGGGGGSQSQSQACNAYLAIEQPMVSQINQASGISQQVPIFQADQGKFSSLASSTAPGQLQSQIQKVADDLGALVSFVQSNTDTSSTPPPQFETLWNTFQNDANSTADACSPGSGGGSGN